MRIFRISFIVLFLTFLLAVVVQARSKKIESRLTKHPESETSTSKDKAPLATTWGSLGGPNSYGYTWLDSDTTGGPTYNWIEIDTIGTKVQFTEWTSPETWPADDGTAGPFGLGFQFVYNGTSYDSIYIGTNGILSFTESDLTRDGYYYYGWIPYLRFPDALLPFYNDLNLDTTIGSLGGGDVYCWTNSVDSFIVEYKNVKPYVYPSTIDTLNFQIILVKTDSSITYQYKTVATPNSGVLGTPVRADSSALIGIQDHSRYFGLRYFAGGIEGYGNLPKESLAVKFKKTSHFFHNVVPRREITYFYHDNPYYYPPHFLFYINAVGNALSENSVIVFNTGQSQENDVPVVCKIYKKDNAGGYTLEDSFFNTISSLPAGDTARVSFFESWAPDTRGSYLITYYTALQADDLPTDDTTSGYLFAEKSELSSPWADTIPTCNGIIEPGEWSDATTLDISKFAVPQPAFELWVLVGPHFYESDGAILYAKNDSSYLYLAFDLLADTSDTEADWISIDIDDNDNKFFDQDSSDGQLSLWNDFIGGFDAMFFWPLISAAFDSFASFGNVEAISGWEFGMQYNGGRMQAEIRIPFGSDPKWNLNSGPGNSIGIWIGIADAGDPYVDNGSVYANQIAYWPWYGIFSYYPQKIGKMHLSTAPDTCTYPIHFIDCGFGVDTYAIIVDSASLDGLQLEECDEIAVFCRDVCVGSILYHPDSIPVLTAYLDGLDCCGQPMSFRLWKRSQDREVCAKAFYAAGNGTFCVGAYSRVWLEAPCEECQDIPLFTGWQWVSSYVQPDPADIESVFADCWDLTNIVVACDGSFCIPGVLCNIPGWNVLEMYKVNMSLPCTLIICGERVSLDTPIVLSPGWNCPGYLPNCPLEPDFALASIWPCLDIVKNDAGEFCIPGVVCMIDCMEPGEGYKVHMACADNLIYPTSCPPCPSPFTRHTPYSQVLTPTHFSYIRNTGESYSIVISSIDSRGKTPEVGDEVGVFTSSGLCVGAGVWQGAVLGISAWADDEQTKATDGFRAGGGMVFKLWDKNENTEIDLQAEFEKGYGSFGTGPYAAVNLTARVSFPLPKSFTLDQNYPNPFNPMTAVKYSLREHCHVRLTIYNILGRKVRVLVDEHQTAGYKLVRWNGKDEQGDDVASGVYFYELTLGEFSETKKMLLLR